MLNGIEGRGTREGVKHKSKSISSSLDYGVHVLYMCSISSILGGGGVQGQGIRVINRMTLQTKSIIV